MADLPDIIDMPQEALDPAQTEHAAQWASRFAPSDTNLAQRFQHNRDISRHVAATQQQQQRMQADALAHDKGAQDLWFREQTLKGQRDRHEQDLMQRDAQFKAKQDAASIFNDVKHETMLAELAAKKAQLALHQSTATDTKLASEKVAAALAEGKIRPRTPEFADFLAGVFAAHPNIGTNTKTSFWTAAGTKLTPEEYSDAKAKRDLDMAAKQQQIDASKAAVARGEMNVDLAKEREQRMAEGQAARELNATKPDGLPAIEKEISRIEKGEPPWMLTTGIKADADGVERFGFPQVPKKGWIDKRQSFEDSLVATPELKEQYQHYQRLLKQRKAIEEGTASGPRQPDTQDKPKTVRQNGVTYTLQPDGSYK